jgi:hypothetical protein
MLKLPPVGSSGVRNGLCQSSSRGAVGESLAKSTVEFQPDQIEVLLGPYTERSLFLGRYRLKSPLVISEVARCQGLFGSQR